MTPLSRISSLICYRAVAIATCLASASVASAQDLDDLGDLDESPVPAPSFAQMATPSPKAIARQTAKPAVRQSESAPGPTLDSLQHEVDGLRSEMTTHDASYDLQLTILQTSLDEKTKENRELKDRISALETATQYRNYVAGMGLQFGPGGPAFGITGRAGFVKGTYFVGRGAMLLLAPEINIWGRVMFQPIGLGVMLNQDPGDAFSARSLRRTVDIAAQSAVSVRIWEGISANLAVTWFLPNPGDAFNKLSRDTERVSRRADQISNVQKKVSNGFKIPLGLEDMTWKEIQQLGEDKLNGFTKDEISALYAPIDVDPRQDWRDVRQIYKEAASSPSVMLNVQWVFK